MFRRFREDRLILGATLVLVVIGLVMVYSASSVMALNRYHDPAYFLKRQALWVMLGLAGMFTMRRYDYRKLRKPALVMLAVVFIMLVAVLVAGSARNGAKRWIIIHGFSIQPSELLKPVLLICISGSLAKRSDRLSDFWYGLAPYLMLTGMLVLLVMMEPDLGTAATIFVVVLAMVFVSGAKLSHLGWMALALVPVLYYELVHVSFRLKRLMVYLDPWQDPLGKGFQAIQSFLAFGGGGLTGLGLGESRQKLLFLPEPHSDFIFSVIGEEFGLIGSLTVASLFVLITFCGIRLALGCDEAFGRVLAFGLTVMLGLQAIINMGVATGLFPNKGMPLPFVSAGGSSVLVALVSVGILLSIARTARDLRVSEGDETRPSLQAR